MIQALAAVLSIALLDLLLISSALGGTCTIPPNASNACPLPLLHGNCGASLEWFEQNEIDCKGTPHPAIMLANKKQLWVISFDPFTVDFSKFKQYAYDESTGICDDSTKIDPAAPAPFTEATATTAKTIHILTVAAPKGTVCYGVFFKLKDGTEIDPHIIVGGTGIIAPHAKPGPKSRKP